MSVSVDRKPSTLAIFLVFLFINYVSMINKCFAFRKLTVEGGCQSWVTDDYQDIRLPNGNRIFVEMPCGLADGVGRTGGGHYTTRPSGNTLIVTETKARLIKTFQWDGENHWFEIKVEPLSSH